MKIEKKAFSIIEILVGIFIFSLGLTSIYSVLTSTLNVNYYNENYIVATNLSREGIELVRNIRDSNYKKFKLYNIKNPESNSFNASDKFEIDKYYKVENDYSSTATFPIKVEEIIDFGEGKSELNNKMQNYRLCLDGENRYTYDCLTNGNKKTNFYRYIKLEKVEDDSRIISNAFKLKSKVIWYKKGYHEFEINTIIADFKRY